MQRSLTLEAAAATCPLALACGHILDQCEPGTGMFAQNHAPECLGRDKQEGCSAFYFASAVKVANAVAPRDEEDGLLIMESLIAAVKVHACTP